MENIRTSEQWQMDLHKALIDDNAIKKLTETLNEEFKKARIIGLQNGVPIYDFNSVDMMNGYKSLIEERQKQIEAHFNANRY